MEFHEAKEHLKTKYLELDFSLLDEHPRELFFERDGHEIRIPEEEIAEYAGVFDQLGHLEQGPNPCSIVGLDYREQMVRPLDLLRGPGLFLTREDGGFVFGDPDREEQYMEIGQASRLFFNSLRFDSDFVESSLERLRRVPSRRQEFVEFPDSILRLVTVRVHNLRAASTNAAISESSKLIDSCLFELSYLKNLSLGVADEWPAMRAVRRPRQFRLDDRHRGRELPMPKSSFNSDLVRFYQLATSTNVPVMQFLSYYQILEYFFVDVSDEQLYERLGARINDPRFRASPRNLDRLIQDVVEHKRATDETEMLKNVLEKFVQESDLIEFIQAYESHLEDNYYTKKRKRFGVEAEVRLNPGHVFWNVAKVVKSVRNALVHSSDQYERGERHVPFSKGTKLVEKEVPLLRSLAERVIIASSSKAAVA